VVAIGEVGLDYHYDYSPRMEQRRAFVRQIALAAELDLPVIVHARDADEDVAAILEEHGREVRGVLHSFASGPALLEVGLRVGWWTSFSGMITFKNYHAADLVRAVPRDRLMVETDSPYLAPVPHRGRRNEPAFVPLVATRAAELRGEDPAELGRVLAANTRAFYRLPG
jgi:TatD DNase family protein